MGSGARTIRQAVILAAGLGTRFRPLTETMPKVLVPVGGAPMLEHTLLLLRDQGISEFLINLHHLPEQVIGHFGDGARWGVKIVYSDERGALLETAGALKKMEPLLDDDFLFLYGDQLHRFDFSPVIAAHRERRALGTLVLKRSDRPENGDCVELDPASGRITRWHPRPHGITEYAERRYLNGGLSVLSKRITAHIAPGRPVKLDGEVMPALVEKGAALFGFPTEDEILDVGTREKYEYAQRWFAARKQ